MMRVESFAKGAWHIELQRPTKRNALAVELYEKLSAELLRIGADPEARVVVLSGAGASFCAGNDLTEFATEWPQPVAGPVVRFLEALHALPVPLVAGVQGAAVGIGATMLLGCDIVVASPDAFLQFPFVERGITAEGASSTLLPQRIGLTRTMDLLLTGRRVLADEALALGLISRISCEMPAADAAIELGRVISAKAPGAVVATKRLVRRGHMAAVSGRFELEIIEINKLILAARSSDGTIAEIATASLEGL